VSITRSKAIISLGVLASLWSSSTGILAFMYGMNKAYKRKETRPFWTVRAMSILFTLALSVIIVLSMTLVVFGEMLGKHFLTVLGFSDGFEIVWDFLRYAVSIATMLIVFILFYYYIPNCDVRIREVLPGSVLSTIGWIVLSLGFAFYVNRFGSYSRIYGSIGAIIALLIWLYWSCIIIFIGSELNSVLAKKKINCS
jgi:membrane protein